MHDKNTDDTKCPQSSTTEHEKGVLCTGIDGSNPLGFLAALGTLGILSDLDKPIPVRMAWEKSRTTWRPRFFNRGHDLEELVEQVVSALGTEDVSPWDMSNKLPFDGERLRTETLSALEFATVHNRQRLDTLAGLGVESVRDEKGNFKDTLLRMVRSGDSAGNGLLAYGRNIIAATDRDDIRAALAGPWRNADEGCALRLNPLENHNYATQWTDPSKEKTTSTRGANRLALVAFQLLPTVPLNNSVTTIGFSKSTGNAFAFTWPLWGSPCDTNTVFTLLSTSALHTQAPDQTFLAALGIQAAYRSARIMPSKYYRNFSPSERVA